MGILNSFIFKFYNEVKINEIPPAYRKYFLEISNFDSPLPIDRNDVCLAVARKLKEEVYLYLKLSKEDLKDANIKGLTGYDIRVYKKIEKEKISVVTQNNEIISAFDFVKNLYDKFKDIEIFRIFNEDLFYMFDLQEQIKKSNIQR